MSQAGGSRPGAALPAGEREGERAQASPRTSDCYRVQADLPSRFDHPGWFRGYRIKERNPLFRTTNMDYGGKPPTVHEMPPPVAVAFLNQTLSTSCFKTCFQTSPHAFTDHLIKFGMYRNTGINTATEKSDVTGPDNFITCFDTFNFHPSYRVGGPSFCE